MRAIPGRIPNKTRYIERLVRKIPGKVAVGCTSIAAFDLYEMRLRECFPDRPVFVVKGDVAFKKRQSIVTSSIPPSTAYWYARSRA